MKLKLLIIPVFLLLTIHSSLLAKSEAILKLDTKGHTSTIRDILVSKDKTEIISVSNDKTIRVWDSKTGMEKRKILGNIKEGIEGSANTIALSKNNRYLAVGGTLNNNGDYEYGNIRIYNYKTGKLIRVLKSHIATVSSLSFSSDDNYLISSSFDSTVKVWDTNMWQVTKNIIIHSDFVYSAKIIIKNNNYYAVSVGYDNKLSLYNITENHEVKTIIYDFNLHSIAVSHNHIAISGVSENISIYDYNLNLIKTVNNGTYARGLKYSKNGKYLIVGSDLQPINVNIYETINYNKVSKFDKHKNSTIAVNFIDEKTAVSGGGSSNTIYTWNINNSKVETKINGSGNPIWSVGIKDNEIAWGNIFDAKENYQKKQSSFQKKINLNSFTITNAVSQNFNRINTINHKYSLKHRKDEKYSDAILDINKDGILVSSIFKNSTNGLRHNCYGWWGNYIISGGVGGQLKIYNRKGLETVSLVGHTDEVWSIALDGDRLVSGSSDQTVKVWDLKEISRNNLNDIEYDEKYILYIMDTMKWSRRKVIEHTNLVEKYFYRSIFKKPLNKETIKIVQNAKKINEYNAKVLMLTNPKLIVEDLKLPLYQPLTTQTIHPILSIFVSKDNEYVAYTKEGFFTSSKGGAKYIGYHINQGVNKEARYVSVDKLYDTYYRPDLIQKALKGEDLSKYTKGIDINSLLKSGLAPEVKIVTSKNFSKKRDLSLDLQVCTIDDGGYDNLTLYLNDKAVDLIDKNRALKLRKQSQVRKECFTLNKLISLQNGENKIGFKATNKAGTIESNLDEIVVNYKGRSGGKPNLHILAIGIDKYRDGDLWLKYSKADAKEFTKSIKKVSKPLFKNIYTYSLTDRDVTKSKVLDMFTKIGAKTTREDVFMLYIAGHGITDAKTGAYFYLPVDFRYKNENSVREKGLSQNDFKLALSKIQAMKSLTILDTCNSGSFAEAMASRGVLQKTAINKLTRAT
ncbi:MAG: caspase family protein, partial [Campylobacterota bacterium]|nr:caspase family protein [Campylobacterota bacterium]